VGPAIPGIGFFIPLPVVPTFCLLRYRIAPYSEGPTVSVKFEQVQRNIEVRFEEIELRDPTNDQSYMARKVEGHPGETVEGTRVIKPGDRRQLLLPVDANYSCRSGVSSFLLLNLTEGHRR
jgi:hypothetical protein